MVSITVANTIGPIGWFIAVIIPSHIALSGSLKDVLFRIQVRVNPRCRGCVPCQEGLHLVIIELFKTIRLIHIHLGVAEGQPNLKSSGGNNVQPMLGVGNIIVVG